MNSQRPVPPGCIMEVSGSDVAQIWSAAYDYAQSLEPIGADNSPLPEAVEKVERLIRTATELAKLFPEELGRGTQDLNHVEGNDTGAMVIQGLLPSPNITAVVPTTRDVPDHNPAVRAASLVGVAAATLFGPPITYREFGEPIHPPERAGIARHFIEQVAPTHDGGSRIKTEKAIPWHTETGAAGELRPNTLALYCIRGDQNTTTLIVPIWRILEELTQADREALEAPLWSVPDGLMPDSENHPRPILSEYEGRPLLTYNAVTVRPFHQGTSSQPLDHLAEILDTPRLQTAYRLEQGDVLALNNDGVHGRTALGNNSLPRWILRILVGADDPHGKQGTLPLVTLEGIK